MHTVDVAKMAARFGLAVLALAACQDAIDRPQASPWTLEEPPPSSSRPAPPERWRADVSARRNHFWFWRSNSPDATVTSTWRLRELRVNFAPGAAPPAAAEIIVYVSGGGFERQPALEISRPAPDLVDVMIPQSTPDELTWIRFELEEATNEEE